MMMFIPLVKIYKNDNEFRSKIQFNHEQYIGEETFFCIGGLSNLNNQIKLKNGQTISTHLHLKSIPALAGISHPQLFEQEEPNHGAMVTIVTFQASDRDLVMARQSSFEEELRTVIAEGQEHHVFLDDIDGIWFSGVEKNTKGSLNLSSQKWSL